MNSRLFPYIQRAGTILPVRFYVISVTQSRSCSSLTRATISNHANGEVYNDDEEGWALRTDYVLRDNLTSFLRCEKRWAPSNEWKKEKGFRSKRVLIGSSVAHRQEEEEDEQEIMGV